MTKSLFIFDLYNTLIFDEFFEKRQQYRLDAVLSLCEKLNYPIRFKDVIDAYAYSQEFMKENQSRYFSVSIFDQVKYFANKLNLSSVIELKKIYDIWAFSSIQVPPILLPYVKEGLLELKESGYKLALISNTASTPGVALRFLMVEYGIYDLFDDMVFSDEFGFMKPKEMIFHRILDHLEIAPNEAVFVGDHEFYDKYGATNVGIEYVCMTPSHNFLEVLRNYLQ
ncbi:MAG: HAD family hydrolase [Brevinemataceae bacterium]